MRINGYTPLIEKNPTAQATVVTSSNSFERILQQAAQGSDDHKLLQACQEMESVFLYQVINAMRATIPRSDFFGSSYGREVFESMLDEKYAREMAKSRSTGLAEIMFQQLQSR